MNRKIAIFTLFLFLNVFWSTEASSPVVLWTLKRIGDVRVNSNLNEYSATQFADLVASKSEHGNIPVIAFGLNSLSLEDLSPQVGFGAVEPFSKLKRLTEASAETLLFPAVQFASDSISILERKGFQVIQINAGDPLPKIENPRSILVVMDKPSVNMDDEIVRVFSKYTLDFPNLVGMLWGKQSTWSDQESNKVLTRKRRQASDNQTQLFAFNDQEGLFMVFREVTLKVQLDDQKGFNSVNFTTATASTFTNVTTNHTLLTLTFAPMQNSNITTTKFELIFNLTKSRFGYWGLSSTNASLVGTDTKPFNFPNVLLKSSVDLVVPINKSFHCSRFGSLYPIRTEEFMDLKQEHSFSIDIKGFQIQAFIGAPNNTVDKFFKEYECVGFFTPGILTGWFITIILLIVLGWGMQMLANVKTMDKFDDPKGTPISFGSGE